MFYLRNLAEFMAKNIAWLLGLSTFVTGNQFQTFFVLLYLLTPLGLG